MLDKEMRDRENTITELKTKNGLKMYPSSSVGPEEWVEVGIF